MLAATDSALHLLRSVFGYSEFRGFQRDVIEHVARGGDALVLMPTGGGKSLCYQLPALLRPGTAVVVSPLIALMQDQVAALHEFGVRAACLNSALDFAAQTTVERDLARGELDLLYVAPERLLTERFLALLDAAPLALFAIDEAHCVSQWGHDFRPEYIELALLCERYPAVPRLALTATADAATRREIVLRLKLERAREFVASFDRPNIRYRVVNKQDTRQQLLRFITEEHAGDAGIVYCMSRRKTEEVAAWLGDAGIHALPYHAGMSAEARATNQHRFRNDDALVMVATVAFGLGIDKPDVRFVAHLDLPKSMEAYYQESGRAGRDGAAADAWLAYGLGDVVQLRRMLGESSAGEAHKRAERQKLDALIGYCESTRCRRATLLAYFGEQAGERCGNCDNCVLPVATWDATVAAQKALSCAYRTGQRYGAGHLIDILIGKATERVLSMGHERLSTFGVGEDLSVAEWRAVFRQLAAAGLLETDAEGYGSLLLTAAARPVLRGEQSVWMRRELPKQQAAARTPKAAAPAAVGKADESLWRALREWRRELSIEHNVPPYVIFHDSTLLAICAARPVDLDALAKMPGVGASKLRRYGERVLTLVADHAHGL